MSLIEIITVSTAILSLSISIYGIFHNRYLAANEFLSKIESKEVIDAKNHIYNNTIDDVKNEQTAIITNLYHHWGLLAKRGYLPMWVFDIATGVATCRLYNKLQGHISLRQSQDNDDSFGEYFVWLVKKLKKRKLIVKILLLSN